MSLHPAPDDDGDWIAALRGQPPAGAAPRTLDEAARVRAALRRQPTTEGEADAGLGALLFRLRREGLLDTRAKTPPRRSWHALAAGLAVAAIALPLAISLLRDTPETPEHLITRGGIVPPHRIEAAVPRTTADELAAGLRAAGASVEFDAQASPLRLTVTIPEDRRAASADFLARHGLKLPAPGQTLRILVLPKPDIPAPSTSNRAPDPRNGGSR
ncbi:MAG: hypothetical protein HS110_11900 [Zoogloeaceae bacterium]|nr:hypothetical protein [Zoogloeaceae bacterium]